MKPSIYVNDINEYKIDAVLFVWKKRKMYP